MQKKMRMLKKYLKKKTPIAIGIDVAIIIALILLAIPATRKDMAALILKPTLLIHQPKVNSNKPVLSTDSYEWKIANSDGITLKFDEFKGKVVFINLWATWCPPCIAEMPDLNKLYLDYADKVEFLFVSHEESAVVNDFIAKKGFSLPVYKPVTQYPADFETNSIPTTFVINKNGEIVISKSGVANWNSRKVRNILDILISQ